MNRLRVSSLQRGARALSGFFRCLRSTCHIRRSVLISRVPDPQLASPVFTPALDPAPACNRARVVIPPGYGDGRETCERNILVGMCWKHAGYGGYGWGHGVCSE
jgi:hypothetical protein